MCQEQYQKQINEEEIIPKEMFNKFLDEVFGHTRENNKKKKKELEN